MQKKVKKVENIKTLREHHRHLVSRVKSEYQVESGVVGVMNVSETSSSRQARLRERGDVAAVGSAERLRNINMTADRAAPVREH